jgi:hypothetical protein
MARARGLDKAHPEYSAPGLFGCSDASTLGDPGACGPFARWSAHGADIVRAMASDEQQRDEQERAGEQDWRMQAELDVPQAGGMLRELIGRLRGPDVVEEIEAKLPREVVITHDGKLLFAYAADRTALAAARSVIEAVLAEDGIGASVRVSHWDDGREKWLQVDPPPTAEERQSEAAAERDGNTLETRTLVVSSGKMIRVEFEQSVREWAERLQLQCTIVEHPHLLTTQLAFTVTGPKHKIDEFARGLRAEERATIRTEGAVMLSPL